MKSITQYLALGATLALMPVAAMATLIGGSHDFTSQSPGSTTFKWGGATGTDATGAGTIAGNSSFYINPCQVCHIPHKAPDAGTTNAPLWNHAMSANPNNNSNRGYITYDAGNSATFAALNLGTATLGSSIACLSCHDGSVAVNQGYGKSFPNANGVTGTVAAPVAGYYAPSTFAIEAATQTAGDFASNKVANQANLGNINLTHMHPIGFSYSAALLKDPTLQPLPAAGTVFAQMLKGPNQTVECASCHDIHNVIGVSGSQSHSVIVDLNMGKLCTTCHQQ